MEIKSVEATFPSYLLGEKEINIGDRFRGYSCGHYFDDQTCTGITEDGLILGTTTVCVFRLECIIKR